MGIVMTDGESRDPQDTAVQGQLAKDAGIFMFAIGIGLNINKNELGSIANEPAADYVFTVTDFSALNSIKTKLSYKTCEGRSISIVANNCFFIFQIQVKVKVGRTVILYPQKYP